MGNDNFIKQFFSNMRCTSCSKGFSEDAVDILREEDNYIVVRVTCENCGKNIGMAILGLDRDDMKRSIQNTSSAVVSEEVNPIGYNDVISAHNFFNALGSDWNKQIPNEKRD